MFAFIVWLTQMLGTGEYSFKHRYPPQSLLFNMKKESMDNVI